MGGLHGWAAQARARERRQTEVQILARHLQLLQSLLQLKELTLLRLAQRLDCLALALLALALLRDGGERNTHQRRTPLLDAREQVVEQVEALVVFLHLHPMVVIAAAAPLLGRIGAEGIHDARRGRVAAQ
eukprot:2487347-Prymnesium_polylepis.1